MISKTAVVLLISIYCTLVIQCDLAEESTTPESKTVKQSLIDEIWRSSDDSPSTPSSTSQTLKPCECVPYYNCKNGTIIRDGEGIIDIRLSDCPSALEKCCDLNDITKRFAPPPYNPVECGYRNRNGIDFKIQEPTDEAEFGEFPWMVAIFYLEEINTRISPIYKCGGALIHPQVVLTAAHCLTKNQTQLKIRAGEWDTQTKHEPLPFQDVEVDFPVIHPHFKPGNLRNDMALLFLKEAIQLAPHINVICLPPTNTTENSRCLSSGWGRDKFGKMGAYQVILKKIDVPIVPNRQCEDQLRKTRLGKFFELDESFVCAGGEIGKDTCTGDGGSPLVCPIPNQEHRYFQTGIVAWGIGCGQENVPGVYVNVALFRQWIDEQLNQRNIHIKPWF